MKARYQYRIYPTDQQRQSLAQVFGCVRVVYNDALALCKQLDKLPPASKAGGCLRLAIAAGAMGTCKSFASRKLRRQNNANEDGKDVVKCDRILIAINYSSTLNRKVLAYDKNSSQERKSAIRH